jgi:MoaA/NifB/PqqE/SkfB family radical SAM enzyme
MILTFDKKIETEKYAILFNTKTGLEITSGINGHPDPTVLNMASLLDIGVMGTCKHKCKFCYQGHIDRPNMKLSDFMRIIDEVSEHTNQVALGGRGDPNHHENFKEIVEYCRKKNVVPNYTTSGIDLDENHVEISKLCGAVAVSDYEQLYTNTALNMLIEAGIKTNIHQIYSSESHIKCIGLIEGHKPLTWGFDHTKLNAVIFLLFKPHGAGANVRHLIPTEAQIKWLGMNIFKPKSKFKIGMDSCLVNHVLQYAEPTKIQRASVDTCEASRMSAYITPDMKMMPCSFADETKFSVPITQGLFPIWENSQPFNQFRNVLTKQQACCPLGL